MALTQEGVKFSDFVRGLPAASEADLSAGNNMPIVSASDIKKMGGENVAKVGDSVRVADFNNLKETVVDEFFSRNMLNPNLFVSGFSINTKSGREVENENYVIYRFIPVTAGKVVFLSRGNLTAQAPNPMACYADADTSTFIQTLNNGDTIPDGCNYVSICLSLATYNAWKKSLQFEYDSMTLYVPYFKPYTQIKTDVFKELLSFYKDKKIIRNVAHQGFSTNTSYYGNSRLSSYVGAAKNGFDFGECDVQFSSDGVPVCCHDATFVDGFSGGTITIADHTAAELKTYQYYGETIATLEEVIAKCKDVGIGLYIDKTINFMSDETKRNFIFSLVKKYAMEDNVVWLIGVNQSYVNAITSWYDRAAISVIPSSYSGGISEGFVTFMNSLDNGKRRISADLNASMVSVEQIKSANALLKCGVTIEVWTIDNEETYQQYKPYVSAITSNKLSERIING